MDALDTKLAEERDRLARTLGALAAAISTLPLDRAADLLPMLAAPIDTLDQRAHKVGLLRD